MIELRSVTKRYGDVVAEVRDFLAARVAACEAAGIARDRIVVDPGFGFGKTPAHNFALLKGLRGVAAADLALHAWLGRFTGQVSLGHAGLFGIGAYTAGVLILKLDAPVYATLPAAIAVAAVFGAMLALPALRVTGPYLAMVTLAFGTIIQILINEMTFLTEGPMGITLTKPTLFGHQLDETEFYWLVMVCLVASLVFVHRVLHSQLGRAFEALRGSPVASDCMGVSVYRYKVYAFVISAALAGLAGSLYAYSEQYISPNTYNFELTVMFLLAIIMGGRKTRTGALLGAAIIVMLPKLLDETNEALAAIPELTGVYAIAGEYDLIAMVEAPSLERLNDVIDAIGRMEGIGRTMSAVVLATRLRFA